MRLGRALVCDADSERRGEEAKRRRIQSCPKPQRRFRASHASTTFSSKRRSPTKAVTARAYELVRPGD